MSDFYSEFMQDIKDRSGGDENLCPLQFCERMCEFLVDQAVIHDYQTTTFKARGIQLDGWSFDESAGILNLIISDFSPFDKGLETLTQTDLKTLKARVEAFFSKSSENRFLNELKKAGNTEAGELCQTVMENIGTDDLLRVRFIILSNRQMSERAQGFLDGGSEELPFSYDIWDFGRIERFLTSGKEKEDILIDFTIEYPEGIPCLPAHTEAADCESYLLAIRGDLLADIYQRYGERLLEQNVRTFLQFRGKVNKGIRETLIKKPEMFFAYNNGLTVTAESVDFENGSLRNAKNLQIVNGGQTTAALFASTKGGKLKNAKGQAEKVDLSHVHVPVKLSVITPEKIADEVPAISRCANTQNTVSASDFFSNHKFHQKMEEFSRGKLAPANESYRHETYWYYERVRGQYANEQLFMTTAEKKKFLKFHPKSQVITKTDFAKYQNTFQMYPHFVCKGAQWNFGKFAERICGSQKKQKSIPGGWDNDEGYFNELYFKRTIAMAIIFRALDQAVFKQPWYAQNKVQIVTYTLSKFVQLVQSENRYIDYLSIWDKQTCPDGLLEELLRISKKVMETITVSDAVGSYCKQTQCWQAVEKIEYSLDSAVHKILITSSENLERESKARDQDRVLQDVSIQFEVYSKPEGYWNAVFDYGLECGFFTFDEEGFFKVARSKTATERQCKIILQLESRAAGEGFEFSE